jgi:hypothetical protein
MKSRNSAAPGRNNLFQNGAPFVTAALDAVPFAVVSVVSMDVQMPEVDRSDATGVRYPKAECGRSAS